MKQYRKEVAERWGKKSLEDSENRVRKMSKEQWNAVKNEGERITKKLATLMNQNPGSREVQECIADWAKFLENFKPVTKEYLLGLGQMYVDDPRFTEHYEKYAKGLAQFKNEAIKIYCQRGMKLE